jgi:hypothetical protein
MRWQSSSSDLDRYARMKAPLTKLFDIYVFAYVFFLASKPLDDPDLWFHLKTGEYIVRNRMIPRADPFSFTYYGYPWIAHGWLSGTIFYLVQSRLGYGALIFLFAALATLAFWFVFRRCNAHMLIAGFAVVLGLLSVSANVGVRPRIFTLLLSSIFLFILEKYTRNGNGRIIWVLIPLMVLWVNLHGAFVIGFALIGLTMIGIVLDKWFGDEQTLLWPHLRTLGLVLSGCVLGTLLNPYGAAMFAVPLRVLQSPIYKSVVVDWLSPDFHRPELFPFLLLFLITTAALALSPVRPKPSEVLLFLATLYASLSSQRNVLIFALVAVPLFASYFQYWLDSNALGKALPRGSSFSRYANLLTPLLLLPLILFAVKLKTTVYGEWRQQTMDVPLKAVEYLKAKQIVGNTFTDPNTWANFLIWAMPSNHVFIDGRDVYPEQFVKEYVDIVTGTSDWREPFDRYRVQVVIASPESVISRELKAVSDWQEVYRDDMAIVFSRRSSARSQGTQTRKQ